jgi:hypothetical protein
MKDVIILGDGNKPADPPEPTTSETWADRYYRVDPEPPIDRALRKMSEVLDKRAAEEEEARRMDPLLGPRPGGLFPR